MSHQSVAEPEPGDRVAVIVGSSVAGVRAAQALRNAGYDGRVMLVGEEPDLPYDKPPLSKQLLAGVWDTNRVALLTTEDAEAAGIELRLGCAATRLDIAAKQVTLTDGTAIDYDVVVLATGAAARPSPWLVKSGLHVLRTLSDSRALRADFAQDRPVVVVGGGFIGAEVAATAHSLGCPVTVVDPLPAPIGRVVGNDVGTLFTELHHRHGVDTRFGVGVEAVSGQTGSLTVRLTDGTELEAGTVVVGIGATPNDGWLESSGLLIENGVTCDEYCRALNYADIFAIGDLARWFHTGHQEYVRVEHWTNAVDSAQVAAHNITHPEALRTYAPIEYVWSDQYDWKVQIVGRTAGGKQPELVGAFSGEAVRGAALYSDDSGVLRGALTINWPKALVTCRRLMAAGTTYDAALAAVRALPRSASSR